MVMKYLLPDTVHELTGILSTRSDILSAAVDRANAVQHEKCARIRLVLPRPGF